MKRLLLIIPLLAMVACSAIDTTDSTTRFAVQYAALKYVESGTGIDTDKAARVYSHVQAVRGYLQEGKQVNVSDLESYIVDRVDWSELSPGDTTAARALIAFLAGELESRISDGAGDRLVIARDLVTIVASTLEPYI